MKASNGLTLFRLCLSIFIVLSIFLVPYEYSPIMIFILISILACWKYNDGRCFSRMYEMDKDKISLEEESTIYPMVNSVMSYSTFETLLNIVILFCSIILLLRYIYQFDFISFTGSIRMIYFSLAFILSIGFFLFSFICMSESKELDNYKQTHSIMFLFLITVISFCYIYLFYNDNETLIQTLNNNNFKEFEIPNHSFEGTSVSVPIIDKELIEVKDSIDLIDSNSYSVTEVPYEEHFEEPSISDDIIIEKVNHLIQQKQI